MAEKVVLDASAILALLRDEDGADEVRRVYAGTLVSAVNSAEVASALVEEGMPIDDVRRRLLGQPLEVVPFAGEQIFEAARLRRSSDHRRLSLADRACVSLARLRAVPALTTDRAWRSLKLGIDERVIR